MHRYFGTLPRDIRAAIGPGVHGCCYTVGPELRAQFESQFEYGSKLFREVEESDPVREKYPLLFLTARAPGHSELPEKIFLDLVEANRRQLLALGSRRSILGFRRSAQPAGLICCFPIARKKELPAA